MRKNGVLAALGAGLMLSGMAVGSVRADDVSVAGRWIYKQDGLRVELAFRPDGQCMATATASGKTSALVGMYRLNPDALVITPKGCQAISYELKMDGDRMILSGGDFGDSELAFAKRGDFAPAGAGGANPLAAARLAPAMVLPPAAPVAATPIAPEPVAAVPVAPAAPIRPLDADAKADAVKLPGGTWDTTALDARFRVVKVKYDSVNGKIVWILEANDAFSNLYPTPTVSYFDEDDVRLLTSPTMFEPDSNIAKGDHVRLTISLPADAVMQKVKRVVIK